MSLLCASVNKCSPLCSLILIWCHTHAGTYLKMLNRWKISLNDLLCGCAHTSVCMCVCAPVIMFPWDVTPSVWWFVYLCMGVCVRRCGCDVNQTVTLRQSPAGKSLLCLEFSTGHTFTNIQSTHKHTPIYTVVFPFFSSSFIDWNRSTQALWSWKLNLKVSDRVESQPSISKYL